MYFGHCKICNSLLFFWNTLFFFLFLRRFCIYCISFQLDFQFLNMNILVQNLSEKNGEKKLPFSPKMFNGSKIGLLGGQKK